MIQIKPLIASEVADFVKVHLACFQDCYHGIYSSEVFEVRRRKENTLEGEGLFLLCFV